MNEIGIYLLIVNALGFYMMWSDKRKAIKDAWRTPERNFFIVALIGGSVGCWAGMQTFRHKTKHIKFTVGIPMILLLQIMVVLWITGQGVGLV
ncbi:MAG: DUF1294 domain-containing protein [Peptococcaceae bacterium]|nr:DUF1294 domain-containing protein [Peptococcaceae bacterium]